MLCVDVSLLRYQSFVALLAVWGMCRGPTARNLKAWAAY